MRSILLQEAEKEFGLKIQLDLNDIVGFLINSRSEGVTLDFRKGWMAKIWPGDDGRCIHGFNPMLADQGIPEAYFSIDNTTHPYGAWLMTEEFSLGIPCRNARVDIDGTMVGIIVEDENGVTRVGKDNKPMRFSFSNLVSQKRSYEIRGDQTVYVDGEFVGYIAGLHRTNAPRVIGYIVVATMKKPDSVRITELNDVRLSKL